MPRLDLLRSAIVWLAALQGLVVGFNGDLSVSNVCAAERQVEGAQAGRGTLTFRLPGSEAGSEAGSDNGDFKPAERPKPAVILAWPGSEATIAESGVANDEAAAGVADDASIADAFAGDDGEGREVAQLGELLTPRSLIRNRRATHAPTKEKVRRVLDYYTRKAVNAADNNCWEVMHWIIAYGVNAKLHRGGPEGPTVNAIGWLSYGNRCAGQPLVYLDRGRITAAKGPRVQGHHGQFLAILAQSKVMTDYPMRAGGQTFTIADLIETEKLGCESGMELTFKLISLAHYLDLDETWLNHAGEEWSVSRLVREEIKAPIPGAACGGTHRLMGLSYAVHERQKRGQPLDGQFFRADSYIRDFHRYTFSQQNPDGSFSTEWFKARGARPDVDRRLQTTGHILEWLVYSAPPEMLSDPRLVRAVNYLADILLEEPDREWSIGPLGHGLHALALYNERVYKGKEKASEPIARRAK
jgi:hypothetical protein